MGCNCKQKPNSSSKPQIIRVNDVVELSEPAKPNYTREEINRAINYVRGISNSPTERNWTMTFHNQHFGEQLIPSCSTCWDRVKTRMEHLNDKLTKYEEYETSRQTQNNT